MDIRILFLVLGICVIFLIRALARAAPILDDPIYFPDDPASNPLRRNSPVYQWAATPAWTLPVLRTNTQRTHCPDLETYKRMIAFAFEECHPARLCVPPVYLEDLLLWFGEAVEAQRLQIDSESLVDDTSMARLLIFPC